MTNSVALSPREYRSAGPAQPWGLSVCGPAQINKYPPHSVRTTHYPNPRAPDVSRIHSSNPLFDYCRSMLGLESWPGGCFSHESTIGGRVRRLCHLTRPISCAIPSSYFPSIIQYAFSSLQYSLLYPIPQQIIFFWTFIS